MALPEAILDQLKEKLRGKSLRTPIMLGNTENKDAQENFKNDLKTKKKNFEKKRQENKENWKNSEKGWKTRTKEI